MSKNETQSAFFHSLKLLAITLIKMIGVFLLFSCRLVALILTKISELLQTKLSDGKGH